MREIIKKSGGRTGSTFTGILHALRNDIDAFSAGYLENVQGLLVPPKDPMQYPNPPLTTTGLAQGRSAWFDIQSHDPYHYPWSGPFWPRGGHKLILVPFCLDKDPRLSDISRAGTSLPSLHPPGGFGISHRTQRPAGARAYWSRTPRNASILSTASGSSPLQWSWTHAQWPIRRAGVECTFLCIPGRCSKNLDSASTTATGCPS